MRVESIRFVGSAFVLTVLASVPATQRTAATTSQLTSTNPRDQALAALIAPYRFHREDDGWAASNPMHEFDLAIDEEGFELCPPSTSTPEWTVKLRTVAYGRAGVMTVLGSATGSATDNRLDLFHGNGFRAWYVNDDTGLEQGWTIQTPPAGSDALPVRIELALEGDLFLELASAGGQAALLDGTNKARVTYSALIAWDSSGAELEAWMEQTPTGLDLLVDDENALYPITIDPLVGRNQWTRTGGSGARFGWAVSPAGNVNNDAFSEIMVSAPRAFGERGRVTVFSGSSFGPMGNGRVLLGENPGDHFGESCALAGDVNGDGFSDVLVGAPDHDGPLLSSGKVYLFLGSQLGLRITPNWTAVGANACAFLGTSVAGVGDVNNDGYSDVLIGSSGHAHHGAAFLYLGSDTGLSDTPDWIMEGTQNRSQFGASLSPAGDVDGDGFSDVLIGSPRLNLGGMNDAGKVFLYHGSASGLEMTPQWTLEGEAPQRRLGESIAGAGDVTGDGFEDVLIGEPNHGTTGQGRVRLFLGSLSGLETTAGWSRTGETDGGRYGELVASASDIDGDGFSDVIIGEPEWAFENSPFAVGRAYVFHGWEGGLGLFPLWEQSSIREASRFGSAGAGVGDINGDGFGDVLFGAPESLSGSGIALLYMGGEAEPGTLIEGSPSWSRLEGTDTQLGRSVDSAGDVNGDGYEDVILGAPQATASTSGEAYVHLGGPNGLELAHSWSFAGTAADDDLGFSVAGAGDVNMDGFDDVLVGARGAGNGTVYAFYGSNTGLPLIPSWTMTSATNEKFGFSVSGAGDVNGDGYDDVLIGATQIAGGRAFLFVGSATGLKNTIQWENTEPLPDHLYGSLVAAAGDVNGDGFDDILVGAIQKVGSPQSPMIFAYPGSPGGPVTAAAWSRIAHTAAGAGDVNADGYDDIVAGQPRAQSNGGRIQMFHGSPAGPSADPDFIVNGTDLGLLGTSLDSLGDANGDGFADIVAGRPGVGRAAAYFGSPAGLVEDGHWQTGNAFSAAQQVGSVVSGAGDVNGDGFPDVLVGAYEFDFRGAAFAYLTNPTSYPAPRVGQWTTDHSNAIPIGGMSDSMEAFGIELEGVRAPLTLSWTSPHATRAWLEWEAAPFPVRFDRGMLQQGLSTDVLNGSSLTFSELVTGLDANQEYAWRTRVRFDHPLVPATPWWSDRCAGVRSAKLRTATQSERPDASSLGSTPQPWR